MEKLELPSALFSFPPGFRFHPSDQELIVHYLQNKVTSHPLPASVIAEINLYKYNPWELPKKALFGEDEWFFFSPRDRKYPNGARPNRAAASGYWKATGTDKPILAFGGSKRIGVKKSLVFYAGRPPKGIKTGWIMNEYRLPDPAIKPSRLKGSMRLDDWVLCRVRQKSNVAKCTNDRGKQSSDSARYLPEVEIAYPASKYSCSMDMDHLYRHCQVMGSLLAGQSLPAIETISTISFQGCNSSPSADSSIYSRVDMPKSSPVAGNGSEGLILPEKKPNEEGCGDDDRVCRMVAVCDRNQCSEPRTQENMFDFQPLDSVINFQEFNGWALKQMLTALP